MKKQHRKTIAAVILVLLVASPMRLTAITGREVAENADNRDVGTTTHALVEMRLVDSSGQTKHRIVEQYGKEQGELSSNVIIFHRPASVEGTRFLTIERADRQDDQWIYLPALGRVRRIAGSEGGDSFMGTDFSYDDLKGWDLEDFSYELLREERVGQWNTYVVEATPLPEADVAYSRVVHYVDRRSWIPVKMELYGRDGQPTKVNRVRRIERVQGYWTIIENTMENVRTGHRTELRVTNFAYNENLPTGLFTVNFLETGRP